MTESNTYQHLPDKPCQACSQLRQVHLIGLAGALASILAAVCSSVAGYTFLSVPVLMPLLVTAYLLVVATIAEPKLYHRKGE